jgi:DnaJ-class molecular chaperone
MTPRMVRCRHCNGCGWDSPPRENRAPCRECAGQGQVPETHPWAGYERTLDYCACHRRNRSAA